MNFSPTRRLFLGASLSGLAAAPLLGADKDKESLPKIPDDAPFHPDTLFLTWHHDPTTTMTVQWVGTPGETPDTTVRYTSSLLGSWEAKPTTVKPYPLSDFKVFRAELTGLTPGTKYWFRIGNQSPVYHFQTMPAKATETIHFVSGGDCGVNQHTVANNIEAAKQDPMFTVIGGDLGYDNGKSVAISLAFLRNYSKHMIGRNGRLIPMVAAIGNHEVDGGYNQTRNKAPFFYALFDGLFPDSGHATLDFGDYLSLVLLDTGHTTPIAGEQTAWLEKTLKARAEHPHVFVVNHVPAYPSYRGIDPVGAGAEETKSSKLGAGEGNRKHWVPLFEKYRTPVVLEHHDHTFKRTKPLIDGLANANGVLYLGDGSWGRLRNPKVPDQLPFMARSSRDYHISLHRIEGEERFHLALDEFGRVMDAAHSGQRKRGLKVAGG